MRGVKLARYVGVLYAAAVLIVTFSAVANSLYPVLMPLWRRFSNSVTVITGIYFKREGGYVDVLC